MSIAGGVRQFANATPQNVAVIDGERRLTYAALHDRSSRLANALTQQGLRPGRQPPRVPRGGRRPGQGGDAHGAGEPPTHADEVGYIVGHSEASALVLDDALAPVAAPAVESQGITTVLSIAGTSLGPAYEVALDAASGVDPRVEVDELEPVTVAYTSGTTGNPKGVMLSHRSRCLAFYGAAGVEPRPGSAHGRADVPRRRLRLRRGPHGRDRVDAALVRPRAAARHDLRRRAQTVFLVPTHAQMLRALGDEVLDRHDLSTLETLYFNAAPMPMPLTEWVLDRFPAVGLHEVDGSTEAGIVTNLRPPDQRRKPGSVGPAWFMTEVRVVDDDGRPVEPGGMGELFSRLPFLMNGYLHDDAATEACTTADGFLSSGDIARSDEDRYVSIVDRKKDLIISGGVNVYPREVEDVLLRHPGWSTQPWWERRQSCGASR